MGDNHRSKALRGLSLLLVTGLVVAGCSSSDDDADKDRAGEEASQPSQAADVPGKGVASPTLTGPVTGGQYDMPFLPLPQRLEDQYRYVEEEYFVSGTATAYAPEGTWTADGQWAAAATTTAPYTTRILVRRPEDPDRYNGTVLVEWLNVTAGMDSDPDFGFLHDELMREGYAYVGVSAQRVGIQGGSGLTIDIPGFEIRPLKEWDPERYEPLDHPGDEYSYDIFSQVAQGLRRPGDIDPLDGAGVEHLLAAGESQSAMRMTTYVNAVHPIAGIYDGFLVHSRGDSGTSLTADGAGGPPPDSHIRTDLDQPVLQFETETDLFRLGFFTARQPDTDRIRTWEVAGTAHADRSTVDYGIESGHEWDPNAQIDFSSLCGRLNEGPQGPVLRRALEALHDWVVDDLPPPTAAPLEVVENSRIARDERGIALGGIRTPATDVPIATLSGESSAESVICTLFGSTTPFDQATIQSLYGTQRDYVDAVMASAEDAWEAGFLIDYDADAFIQAAQDLPPF